MEGRNFRIVVTRDFDSAAKAIEGIGELSNTVFSAGTTDSVKIIETIHTGGMNEITRDELNKFAEVEQAN